MALGFASGLILSQVPVIGHADEGGLIAYTK